MNFKAFLCVTVMALAFVEKSEAVEVSIENKSSHTVWAYSAPALADVGSIASADIWLIRVGQFASHFLSMTPVYPGKEARLDVPDGTDLVMYRKDVSGLWANASAMWSGCPDFKTLRKIYQGEDVLEALSSEEIGRLRVAANKIERFSVRIPRGKIYLKWEVRDAGENSIDAYYINCFGILRKFDSGSTTYTLGF